MAKTEQKKFIESRLWAKNNIMGLFGCFEVTIGWYGNEIVDFITYKTNGEFRCYEIKTSVQDFYSKARLSFVGDFNYYVIPEELYLKLKERASREYKDRDNSEYFKDVYDERIKNSGIGLVTVSERGYLTTKIKPKRKYPDMSDKTNLLQCMVRSLNRQVTKAYKVKGYWE